MRILDPMNMIFPPPCINPAVKEFGICIAFFKIVNSCTLPLTRSFEHGQGNDPSLEPSPELKFVGGEESILLSDVKAKDHQKRGLVVNFCLREKAPTPFGESECSLLSLW